MKDLLSVFPVPQHYVGDDLDKISWKQRASFTSVNRNIDNCCGWI